MNFVNTENSYILLKIELVNGFVQSRIDDIYIIRREINSLFLFI